MRKLLLSVCTAFHDDAVRRAVPRQPLAQAGRSTVTASVCVGVGIRKLDGGCSWLLRLTPVVNVGRNAPLAAATRVSLICGSSRSAFRSTLWSSAILTASSTVSRSGAGAGVCAERRGRQCEREGREQDQSFAWLHL